MTPTSDDIMVMPAGAGARPHPAIDAELLGVRERADAEIGALHAEIERLMEIKEQARADLRRWFEDGLARLDGDGIRPARAREKEPRRWLPETAAQEKPGESLPPAARLLQGLASLLFNPAKSRLALAGGWDQVPMLLVLTLILLQQLLPAIQRMSSVG